MENNNEQLSTKEFLKSVFSYFQFLGKNWQILLIAFLIGNIYDTVKNNILTRDDKYGGGIEFTIDLEGGSNQMGGLASAFGIQMGGGAGGGLNDRQNFMRVMLSPTVFEEALMREVVHSDSIKQLFVNYFIDSSDITTKEWGKKFYRPELSFVNYRFDEKSIKEFTRYENELIRTIITKLANDTFLEKDLDSHIYILEAVLSNEELTKVWLETLVKATEDYYSRINTEKTRRLIAIQQKRVDSLETVLSRVDRNMARSNFELMDSVDPMASARTARLSRDNSYLSSMYLTSVTSLESLHNLLVEQTSIFQILNPVTLPLTVTSYGGISMRLTGLILVVGTIVMLSIRKSFKEIMNEE